MTIDIQAQLRKFNELGYADPDAKYQNNGKGGQILRLTDEQWTYEDEFYGGEPYSGNETIWYGDQVYFRCVYWGKVIAGIQFADIYDFLKKALRQGPSGNAVHRGPECFTENNLVYTNTTQGDSNSFQSVERIFQAGVEVYTAWFNGGLVNVQNE